MYHRNTGTPPPGYGGTAFDMRPAWPPREEPPREPKRGSEPSGFAPFAAGKRPVQETPPSLPTASEMPPSETLPRETEDPEKRSLSEDTLLLFGVLLLLMHGEEGGDLLPLLSMLLLL